MWQTDTSTSNGKQCCNLGCSNVLFTFERVKIIVNDLIQLNFLKQAVDLFIQSIELKISQRIATESREYLQFNCLNISVSYTFCIEVVQETGTLFIFNKS
jgi:hypothetical protein